MDALIDKLTRLLADLGDDADAVARSLKRARVRGVPCDAERCVVATYLGKRCRRAGFLVNVSSAATAYARLCYVKVPLPLPVYEFASRFDLHKYPALEAR